MYEIHYQRLNPVTNRWTRHSYRAESENEFTLIMLQYAWEVTTGEFIILHVSKGNA